MTQALHRITTFIKIDEIDLGTRARKIYGNIEELKQSITEHGLLQPIVVMKQQESCPYLLIVGGRRVRAYKELGFASIYAGVQAYIPEKYQRKILELVENKDRLNLTWAEECLLTEEIHTSQVAIHGAVSRGTTFEGAEKPGWSLDDTAELLGMSRAPVSKNIALAKEIKKNPKLENAKSRMDALKILASAAEAILLEEQAKRRKAKLALDSSEIATKQETIMRGYIVADTFDEMSKIPDQSIDFIDLDWPYGIDLSHKSFTENRDQQTEALMGLGETSAEDYIQFMNNCIANCYRILKKDAWMVVWYAIDPWHQPTLDILRKRGFVVGVPAFWCKTSGHTRTPNCHFPNTVEPFFYARKGGSVLNKIARPAGNQFNFAQSSKKMHPTEKPITLMQCILDCFCHPTAKVFVPFAGSGNVLLAAANLGLEAKGVDINLDYKSVFDLRVMERAPGEYGVKNVEGESK